MTERLNRRHAELQEELFHMRNDYLELVQCCLTGSIYRDANQSPFGPRSFDPDRRAHGLDWPSRAQTMVGEKRLANLRTLIESVIADNVPGDLIETGVWRGGACILMRAVLFAHGITGRTVWVADSFEGLPSANEQQYPADAGSDFHTYEQLAVSIDEVKDNFQTYGFLDEWTKFLKGWFKDTLPVAPISQLALLRLDGDMYESTIDALTYLYPKLSHQGYVIIDDYHLVPACKAAVRDYCKKNDINPDIIDIDGIGVFWRKADVAGQSRVPAGPRPSVAPPEMQISRLSEAVLQLNQYVTIQLNRSLAERDEEVAGLNRSLAERDDVVAGLNRSLAERDDEVAGLNRSLAERDEEVAGLNRSLAERDEEVARLSQSLNERDAEIGRLQLELKNVYSSASWRITEPFRVIKKFIIGMQFNHD